MSLTTTAHKIISDRFNSINLAVDATCGNGNDTVFLAGLCAPGGKIYSFDIQKTALELTSEKIKGLRLEDNVKLIHDGHENISDYISRGGVDVFIYNLGYLPGSEKKITTKARTTIESLNYAINLLINNGLISIICYPGHEEGKAETDKVKEWLRSLNKNRFLITEHLSELPEDTTPVLYIVEKLN